MQALALFFDSLQALDFTNQRKEVVCRLRNTAMVYPKQRKMSTTNKWAHKFGGRTNYFLHKWGSVDANDYFMGKCTSNMIIFKGMQNEMVEVWGVWSHLMKIWGGKILHKKIHESGEVVTFPKKGYFQGQDTCEDYSLFDTSNFGGGGICSLSNGGCVRCHIHIDSTVGVVWIK